jgi:type VI secretion system secreted protein VgrG
VYKFSAAAQLTGTLTLNAENNPDAVFIFQIGTTLITASSAQVSLINGAQAQNVFWQVGTSATLGSSTAFQGTIMANASVTANSGASIQGRVLATAAVTLSGNTITAP